jgi:hypothetical protein
MTRCPRFAAPQLSVFPTFTYKQLKHFPVRMFFWRLLATLRDANMYVAFQNFLEATQVKEHVNKSAGASSDL